jgi:UDP-glucose 4-epimerase
MVTGGAGFIGSQVTTRLLASGYRVLVVDRLSYGAERIEGLLRDARVSLVEGDVRDEAVMATVSSMGPFQTVFHLAGIHYIPYCATHPVETLSTNVVGTQAVLDAVKRNPPRRFILASTADVYAPKDSPHDETDLLEPPSIYGLSKLFAERLVASAASEMSGTTCVIARLFNVYGPGDTNPHLIPAIVAQLKRAEHLRLGNTSSRRDYVHVSDASEALTTLGKADGTAKLGYYNIGTGVATSVEEVVALFSAILSTHRESGTDPDRIRPSERPHLQASIARIHNVTGWLPVTDLQSGLRQLCMLEGLIDTTNIRGS